MRRWILWVPLLVFVLFVGLVTSGLVHPPTTTIASKMIGRPMPPFDLPPAVPGKPPLASAQLGGRPRLVNVFASWCVPCATETPQLEQLRLAGVEVDGIAIRDRPEDLGRFLRQWGDPYSRIGSDRDSSVQLAMGSSGVPETFVIDARGIIRKQHVGAIEPQDLPEMMQAVQDAK